MLNMAKIPKDTAIVPVLVVGWSNSYVLNRVNNSTLAPWPGSLSLLELPLSSSSLELPPKLFCSPDARKKSV